MNAPGGAHGGAAGAASGRISVIVADDHPAMIVGVKTILQADPRIRVVGEAGGGLEAIEIAAIHRPDVALLDLSMPGADGAKATRAISERSPDTAVVILSNYGREADLARALEAGAAAYLLKEAMHAELIGAVRRAARGDVPLASGAGMGFLRQPGAGPYAGLSDREVTCLRMASRGLTNKQIARELFVGNETVKTFFDRAYKKLGVRDRTAAVYEATKRGYMDAPEP